MELWRLGIGVRFALKDFPLCSSTFEGKAILRNALPRPRRKKALRIQNVTDEPLVAGLPWIPVSEICHNRSGTVATGIGTLCYLL